MAVTLPPVAREPRDMIQCPTTMFTSEVISGSPGLAAYSKAHTACGGEPWDLGVPGKEIPYKKRRVGAGSQRT